MGITESVAWDRPKLERTDFYRQHREVLDRRKGGGLWLWKPTSSTGNCSAWPRETFSFTPIADILAAAGHSPVLSLLHWCETRTAAYCRVSCAQARPQS